MFYHRGVLEESISAWEFQNYKYLLKGRDGGFPHLLTYLFV